MHALWKFLRSGVGWQKNGSVLCFHVGFGGRGCLCLRRTESESTIYESQIQQIMHIIAIIIHYYVHIFILFGVYLFFFVYIYLFLFCAWLLRLPKSIWLLPFHCLYDAESWRSDSKASTERLYIFLHCIIVYRI